MLQLEPAQTIRKPRPYQQQCVDLTLAACSNQYGSRKMYYALPTGTGKTRILTMLIDHFRHSGRILVIAHRKELIQQTATAITHDIPGAKPGIVMADQNEFWYDVVVGSIQTLTRGRLTNIVHPMHGEIFYEQRDHPLVAVLIDESHHVIPGNAYHRLIEDVERVYPACVFIGCTATPFRADKARMQEVLPVCTFERTIADMQQEGWLSPVIWERVTLPESFDDIPTSQLGGEKDYQTGALIAKINPHNAYIVSETGKKLATRPTVVFAGSVGHAIDLAGEYRRHGFTAQAIWGDMPRDERAMILRDWKQGRIQIVVNVGILTEGFDYTPLSPNTEGLAGLVIACPTMSPGRYLQMLGRGTRLKPGMYQDCLVFDVSGNANLLETKQVMLPRLMPDLPEENDGQLVYGLKTSKKITQPLEGKKKKPVKLRINDPFQSSWIAWNYNAALETYYTCVTFQANVALIRHPVSGLFHGYVMLEQEGQIIHKPLFISGLPLIEAMGHVNHFIAKNGLKSLTDKKAGWRRDLASTSQINYIRLLCPEYATLSINDQWTKEEASLVITWAKIGTIVKTLKERMKEHE